MEITTTTMGMVGTMGVSTRDFRHAALRSLETWTMSWLEAATVQENRKNKVEFKRISLTGFRSCTSRSRYRSVSKQTTQLERMPPFQYQRSRNEKADRNVLISVRNETEIF
ncbi:hypothetical protein Tco_0530716 [Tanacetum coccineum]